MNKRYRKLETLAIRPYGMVWLALDQDQSKKVILKGIRKNVLRTLLLQFEREADFLKRHSSPYMPKFLDAFADENFFFLVTSCFDDCISLEQWLKTRPSMKKKKRLFASLIALYQRVHQLGYLYVDSKPEHVLVCPQDGLARLIDFGSIVPAGSSRLFSASSCSLPPEAQTSTALNEQADQIGLAMLYEMIFGKSTLFWIARQSDPCKRFEDLNALKAWLNRDYRSFKNAFPLLLILMLVVSFPMCFQNIPWSVHAVDEEIISRYQIESTIESQNFVGARKLMNQFERLPLDLEPETLDELIALAGKPLTDKEQTQLMDWILEQPEFGKSCLLLRWLDQDFKPDEKQIIDLKAGISSFPGIYEKQGLVLMNFLLTQPDLSRDCRLSQPLRETLMENDAGRQMLGFYERSLQK